VQVSGRLSWRKLLRKTSKFSKKRGAFGPLRFLAHTNAANKVTQLLTNGLLLRLLSPFGVNQRDIYTKLYGEDMMKFMLDGTPLPMTADKLPEGDGITNELVPA
jgi:hypothetical protein